jgi:hypothetical protein
VDKVTTSKYAIRGREQMLMDHWRSRSKLTDQIRGIRENNPKIRKYLRKALEIFGDL